MNVIICNKYKEMLMGLNIEVIKSMDGVFTIDEIIETFDNFYFDKMLLDITAIKDHENLDNLQKLSMNFDMNKIILILDDTPESNSKGYLSRLISMGIYNFTKNLEGINYLLVHSNTYKDVVYIHNLPDDGSGETQEEKETSTNTFTTQFIEAQKLKIIGLRNITEHAGATSLIYMMKKQLEENYNVVAVEVNKRDFSLFNDEKMVSTDSVGLPKEFMKYQNYEVMLIDLNDYEDDSVCSTVLYLVEPSTIKLNKLIRRKKTIFNEIKNEKIVLNKCLLNSTDVAEFEYEAKVKTFCKLPPLDERKNKIKEINKMLVKLGFKKQVETEENKDKKNILGGVFKF